MSRKGLCGVKVGLVPSRIQVPVCLFPDGKIGLPVVSVMPSFSFNLHPSSDTHVDATLGLQWTCGTSLLL